MMERQEKPALIKRVFYYMLIAATVLALLALLYMQIVMRMQAHKLAEQEEYTAAEQIYRKIGSSKKAEHCAALQLQKDYLEARAAMDAGEYDKARAAFEALGSYRASAALIDSCDLLQALDYIASDDFLAARELLLEMPADYPGCDEAMEKACAGIRLMGMELALQGDYAAAAELWRPLGSYDDCEKLVFRVERMQQWLAGTERLLSPESPRLSKFYDYVYVSDEAYIVMPEEYDKDCSFMLYYPGGMDYELNIDFLYYYLMNPAPDTITVFLRQNGISSMELKISQALELMERVAAECGLFMHDIVVVGSSMGAYPAAHSPRLSMEQLGVSVDCVLALDAGGNWGYEYSLTEENCRETAKLETEFYLFESPGVGLNVPAINLMVQNGMSVTMVACLYDEHERMTYDAMGMGVLHWAVSDRTEPCPLEIYTFNKLYNE